MAMVKFKKDAFVNGSRYFKDPEPVYIPDEFVEGLVEAEVVKVVEGAEDEVLEDTDTKKYAQTNQFSKQFSASAWKFYVDNKITPEMFAAAEITATGRGGSITINDMVKAAKDQEWQVS